MSKASGEQAVREAIRVGEWRRTVTSYELRATSDDRERRTTSDERRATSDEYEMTQMSLGPKFLLVVVTVVRHCSS